MQRYIALVTYQNIRGCIEERHGSACHFLRCIHGIILLEHAPTLIHTFLYAHTFHVGTPPLTVAKLGPRSPLSGFPAQANNAPMLAREGESNMSLLESPD